MGARIVPDSVAVLGFACLALLVAGYILNSKAILAIAVLMLAVAGVTWWAYRRALECGARDGYAGFVRFGEPRYVFSDDGLRYEAELSSTSLSWKAFEGLLETDATYVLLLPAMGFVALPKRAVSADEAAAIGERLGASA